MNTKEFEEIQDKLEINRQYLELLGEIRHSILSILNKANLVQYRKAVCVKWNGISITIGKNQIKKIERDLKEIEKEYNMHEAFRYNNSRSLHIDLEFNEEVML